MGARIVAVKGNIQGTVGNRRTLDGLDLGRQPLGQYFPAALDANEDQVLDTLVSSRISWAMRVRARSMSRASMMRALILGLMKPPK